MSYREYGRRSKYGYYVCSLLRFPIGSGLPYAYGALNNSITFGALNSGYRWDFSFQKAGKSGAFFVARKKAVRKMEAFAKEKARVFSRWHGLHWRCVTGNMRMMDLMALILTKSTEGIAQHAFNGMKQLSRELPRRLFGRYRRTNASDPGTVPFDGFIHETWNVYAQDGRVEDARQICADIQKVPDASCLMAITQRCSCKRKEICSKKRGSLGDITLRIMRYLYHKQKLSPFEKKTALPRENLQVFVENQGYAEKLNGEYCRSVRGTINLNA
eukprot:Gb_40824 [translate_table: standard]